MSDLVDQAQERDMMFRELALRDHTLRHGARAGAHLVMDVPVKPRGCQDCGDPIPPERLSAVPATRRCAFCAEQWEARRA